MVDRELIQNDNFLYIQNESSDELIIVFSGIHAINFMGYKLLSEYSANKLFIRDPTKGWYNRNIPGLSTDANNLKDVIEKVVSAYDRTKITTFGSSMGGYAALLFGLQLKVGRILVFSAQVKLNTGLPNNPASMDNIIYPDLNPLIESAKDTRIEYFFGMEEITDFYHIQYCSEFSHIKIHCIINAPHNVMGYFNTFGQLKPLLINYLENNKLPAGILEIDFWKNKTLLNSIIEVLESFSNNKLLESTKKLESLLQEVPNWSGGLVFLAKMYRQQRLYKSALDAAQKSIFLNSQLDIAHHELGMVQFAYNNYPAAIDSFNNAIDLASKPKAIDFIKLCISYRESGKYVEAYKVITSAKKLYPNNFGVYFHSGKILELKNNNQAALAFYRKAHQLAPKNQTIIENIEQINAKVLKNASKPTYKIFCGGDTILTRYMHSYKEANGTQWIINDLKKLTDEADLSMLNLECVISNKGSVLAKKEYRPFHYRGAPELAEILVDLNVAVVFTANNHTVDFGADALLEQKNYFSRIGIATPGSGENYQQASQPVYAQVGEYVIAIVSIFTFADEAVYAAEINKPGVFHETQSQSILDAVYTAYIEARKNADLVIVSPHWTQNWATEPTQVVISLAHAFIDMGYDAVLGHSSHLMQGIELYKSHPVIYDMGVLLADFAKGNDEMPYQAAFMLTIKQGQFNALEIIPIELKNGRTILATGNNAQIIRDNIKNRSEALDPSIEFFRVGERLLVEFEYNKYHTNHIKQRATDFPVFSSNFDKKILNEWINCKPNIVSPKLDAINTIQPIKLENNGWITHISFPESFYKGSGFLLQMVFLQATRFEKGRYEVHLLGVNQQKESQFYVQHPVSQGVYNPAKWEHNEMILDKTVIRPRVDIKQGMYRLYIGFMNHTTQTFLQSSSDNLEMQNGLIFIGEIELIGVNRGNYTAGLDWSGALKDM